MPPVTKKMIEEMIARSQASDRAWRARNPDCTRRGGGKRERVGKRKDNRRRQHAVRQDSLRTLIEDGFRGSSSDVRAREEDAPAPIVRTKRTLFPPGGQNRSLPLVDDDNMNDGIDTKSGQKEDVTMGESQTGPDTMNGQKLRPPVEESQQHIDPAIEEITHRMDCLTSPITHYNKATDQAMSLDFSEIIRGDSGSFTSSGEISEEENL
ncbi:uncharacterized protein LY89DRAFT_679419 [Mollisia scopiformis]|uniref:Uncharacterized protein n=1 Tax=Mollisia scopiformis TaxID=149040 RepID=A0A194XW40_MOLSC|nr:uncharacterized protein LY89DRAFT_679419 [Mollisia scopiformis]KUJ24229.1 hypothetical protein LY89DRAFT_679419 [Mollisia scopiformis]